MGKEQMEIVGLDTGTGDEKIWGLSSNEDLIKLIRIIEENRKEINKQAKIINRLINS